MILPYMNNSNSESETTTVNVCFHNTIIVKSLPSGLMEACAFLLTNIDNTLFS